MVIDRKEKRRLWRAFLASAATGLGNFGGFFHGILQHQNDVQSDRIEEMLEEAISQEKMDERVETSIRRIFVEHLNASELQAGAATAVLSAVTSDVGTQQLLLIDDDVQVEAQVTAIVSRYKPDGDLSLKSVEWKLRDGLEKSSYREANELWLVIERSGFTEVRFPFGVHPMEEVYSRFADALWGEEISVQLDALGILARRNPLIAEIKQARIYHALLVEQNRGGG